MDVLVVEPMDGEVLQWLSARHPVRYAPELLQNSAKFRAALSQVRALVIPPSVAIDVALLKRAPALCVVGQMSNGADNIDVHACARSGVELVRPTSAGAAAEAEFIVGALLQLLRRVPVVSDAGLLVGRELGAALVGLVGMAPATRLLAKLLGAFGAAVQGYDPGLHASDPAWARAGIQPVGLRELMHSSDAVCVLLGYYPRYAGLFGERLLSECKSNQVLVSVGHSSLFSEAALALALTSGGMAAAWLDSVEPGLLDSGRALRHVDTLQITPRLAATTRESRTRSAWAVVRRIDEVLQGRGDRSDFRPPSQDDFADLEVARPTA